MASLGRRTSCLPPLCRWHCSGCCLPAVQIVTRNWQYPGSSSKRPEGERAGSGRLPTALCVPTQSRCAVSGGFSTYSPHKVFSYILKLALREPCVVILVLREVTVSENFHRKEWILGVVFFLLLLCSQGWGSGESWCPLESFAPVRPGRWVLLGHELLGLAAPLLFWFSSSIKEFPATEVAVWASSSFCHSGWLEFQKENPRHNPHTSVYPGLPSVPLACWCHRVAPCSTCISTAFSFPAEIIKVFRSDMSLLLPGTNQNPRALDVSACCALLWKRDFFWKRNTVFF